MELGWCWAFGLEVSMGWFLPCFAFALLLLFSSRCMFCVCVVFWGGEWGGFFLVLLCLFFFFVRMRVGCVCCAFCFCCGLFALTFGFCFPFWSVNNTSRPSPPLSCGPTEHAIGWTGFFRPYFLSDEPWQGGVSG